VNSCSNHRNSMTQLLVGSNLLSGTINFYDKDFPALMFLNYGLNQLSGEIPAQLAQLTALRTLLLGVNQLSGHILPSLSSLINLNQLELSQNRLSGSSQPDFQSWKDLSALSIFQNHRLEFDLNLLPLLPKLQYALLHSCSIRGIPSPHTELSLPALSHTGRAQVTCHKMLHWS